MLLKSTQQETSLYVNLIRGEECKLFYKVCPLQARGGARTAVFCYRHTIDFPSRRRGYRSVPAPTYSISLHIKQDL